MKDLYIIGASGHGREVLWLLERLGTFEVKGFVDDDISLHGSEICGMPVLGPISFLEDVGQSAVAWGLGFPHLKALIYDRLSHLPLRWPTLVDPSVQMSSFVELGRGVTVCAGSILTTQVEIGDFALVNVSCTLSHDVTVGQMTMLSPGTHLTGNVSVGARANLGAGVDVIPGVRIDDDAIIGAGAVVIDDIPAGATAVGNPARVIKQRSTPAPAEA